MCVSFRLRHQSLLRAAVRCGAARLQLETQKIHPVFRPATPWTPCTTRHAPPLQSNPAQPNPTRRIWPGRLAGIHPHDRQRSELQHEVGVICIRIYAFSCLEVYCGFRSPLSLSVALRSCSSPTGAACSRRSPPCQPPPSLCRLEHCGAAESRPERCGEARR